MKTPRRFLLLSKNCRFRTIAALLGTLQFKMSFLIYILIYIWYFLIQFLIVKKAHTVQSKPSNFLNNFFRDHRKIMEAFIYILQTPMFFFHHHCFSSILKVLWVTDWDTYKPHCQINLPIVLSETFKWT